MQAISTSNFRLQVSTSTIDANRNRNTNRGGAWSGIRTRQEGVYSIGQKASKLTGRNRASEAALTFFRSIADITAQKKTHRQELISFLGRVHEGYPDLAFPESTLPDTVCRSACYIDYQKLFGRVCEGYPDLVFPDSTLPDIVCPHLIPV